MYSVIDLVGYESHLLESGLSKTTISNYLVAIGAIAKEVDEFQEDKIRSFVLHKLKTISHSGVNKYKKAISHYCKFLGIESFACCKKVKEEAAPRVLLTNEEIEHFVEIESDSKYAIFWMICGWSGMRTVEVRLLTTDCITDETIIIKKSKTGRGRVIPLAPRIKDDVLHYVGTCENLLFPSPRNKSIPLNHASILKDFKKRLSILGIRKPVKPYSFRHSWVTRNVHTSLYDVQDIAGHSNANQTKTYFHGNLDSMKYVMDNDPLNYDCLPVAEQTSLLVTDLEKIVRSKKNFQIEEEKVNSQFGTIWLKVTIRPPPNVVGTPRRR